MNPLDLPLHVVLAGWLLRRLTKPAKVSNVSVSTPEEVWRATRDAIDSLYADRSKFELAMAKGTIAALYDVIYEYKMSQLESLKNLEDMGIDFMATIKKEE